MFRPCHGPSSVLDGITSRHHTSSLGLRKHKEYGLKLDYGVATHCLMKSAGVSQPPSCKRLLKPFLVPNRSPVTLITLSPNVEIRTGLDCPVIHCRIIPQQACMPQFPSGGHRASQPQYSPCSVHTDDPPVQVSANNN